METTAEWTNETDRAPEQPDSEQPDSEQPDSEQPDSEQPDSEQPDSEQPDSEQPDSEQPDSEQPDSEQPDSSTSELRAEAARYRRQRSELREQVDELQRQLFTERVRSTGLMIDPTDMPMNAELLDSPEELRQHVEEYLQQRPHLRRRQFPQIGVHEQGRAAGPSLADILRNHA